MKYQTKMAIAGLALILAIILVPLMASGPTGGPTFEQTVVKVKAANPGISDEQAKNVANALMTPLPPEKVEAARLRRQQQTEETEALRKAAWCVENGVRCD